MKKENVSKIRKSVAALTMMTAFGLSVAAQQSEPVCSKYYGVGMRTCAASVTSDADGRGGTLTTAGGRTESSSLASADGGGGLGSGNFWDWLADIF